MLRVARRVFTRAHSIFAPCIALADTAVYLRAFGLHLGNLGFADALYRAQLLLGGVRQRLHGVYAALLELLDIGCSHSQLLHGAPGLVSVRVPARKARKAQHFLWLAVAGTPAAFRWDMVPPAHAPPPPLSGAHQTRPLARPALWH